MSSAYDHYVEKIECDHCGMLGCDLCAGTGYIVPAEMPVRENSTEHREPEPIGLAILAFMNTLVPNMERAHKTGHNLTAEEVSNAEGQLGIELMKAKLEYVQQFQIGPFFADFWFPSANLVVEVDGAQYHLDKEKDQRRTAYLLNNGVTNVLRLPAKMVFDQPNECMRRIRSWL